MLMTRCPHCGTAFRVKPEQLRARGGRVRCGHCQAPFSALESLIDSPPAVLSPDEVRAEPEITPTPAGNSASPVSLAAAPAPAAVAATATDTTPAPTVARVPPTVEPTRTPLAVNSALATHRTSSWAGTSTTEIVPPMPELDPAAPPRSTTYELDFDLDAEVPAPTPTVAAPITPPATDDFVRPARADERTTLTFDWRAGSEIPGGHGGAAQAHEAEVDLAASDWHSEPVEHSPAEALSEVPLETEELTPADADDAPVFVTAYASPAGVAQEPSWPTDIHEFEAIEEDRFAPLPEPVVASANVVGDENHSVPGEPELIEHSDEEDEPPHEEAPQFAWEKPRSSRAVSWMWALSILVLFSGVLAQGLLWARHDIARELPETRPLFEAACKQLGCAMPWPRVSAQISIDASDLHPRPGKDGQFELSGTLRNKAAFSQSYPYIEVTLTDVFNRALVRRAIPPEEWLPPAQPHSQAFAAGSDVSFTLYLDATGQKATGYKLYAFYP